MILAPSLTGHSFAFQQWFLLSVSDSSTYTRTSWICILGILKVISNVICPAFLSFYFHTIPVPFHEFCISMNINTIFLTILSIKRVNEDSKLSLFSPVQGTTKSHKFTFEYILTPFSSHSHFLFFVISRLHNCKCALLLFLPPVSLPLETICAMVSYIWATYGL